MTCQHRTCRLAAVAFFTLALGAVGHEQATWADTPKPSKPARPTIALHCGGAAEDLNVLRKTLEKAPGVKFQADDLKFADFGRDGGLFTSFFTIEMADRSQTDIGAIAKAVSAAPTSKREQCPPALFVILRYRPGTAKNEPFRAALANVKGVQPEKSWVGDANLWVSVDSSGQCKLLEVTTALHDAGIKFKDPITDVD